MSKPVMVYEFRANKDMYDQADLLHFLEKLGKKFCFQLEKSDSDYEHWQGRLSLFKKRRKTELMELMKGMDMPVPNYLEPTISAEHQRTAFYCLKEDTRIEGPWSNTDVVKYVPRQYRGISLYEYQEAILASAHIFNDRQVDCVIDVTGNNGKSTVAALADLKLGGIDLPTINDHERLIATMCDICYAKDTRTPKIVFIDLPRSFEKKYLQSMYTAIEQIKKGKLYDLRYAYKEYWIDAPRVWVFTNKEPATDLLSRDRWKFWSITDDKKLVPYERPDVVVH